MNNNNGNIIIHLDIDNTVDLYFIYILFIFFIKIGPSPLRFNPGSNTFELYIR